jgi:Cysteine-rich secretory protein family
MKTPLQLSRRGAFGWEGNRCEASTSRQRRKKNFRKVFDTQKSPEKSRSLAPSLLLQRHVKFVAAFLLFLCLNALAQAGELSERVFAEINLARSNPHEYSQLLLAKMGGSAGRDVADAVRFLEKSRPLPALNFSTGLCQGASLHCADQGPRGNVGHNGSGWGNSPWSRMARYGQWLGSAGENIYYGGRDARGIVCAWIVDSGVSGKGHRKNIFSPAFGVAGVAAGPHASFGAMCVMDFATNYIEHGSTLAGL